jgi:DNA-binding XRE family transcriptional regulator
MLRLARERKRKGITQRQASERVKCAYWTCVKVEEGVTAVSADSPLAKKLSRFFGYSIKTLLSEAP